MKLLMLVMFFTTSLNAATLALNVMMTTDDQSKEWSEVSNKIFFEKYPQGFRFNDSHLAHISLLHMYVEISCLDDKWNDIEKEIRNSKLLNEILVTKSKEVITLPSPSNLAMAKITFNSSAKLIKLQEALLKILTPCKSETENVKAFYGTVPADNMIVNYVKQFPATSIGKDYSPHLTLGVAPLSDAEKVLSTLTPPTEMKIKRIGVFRTGIYGTARERMFSF